MQTDEPAIWYGDKEKIRCFHESCFNVRSSVYHINPQKDLLRCLMPMQINLVLYLQILLG